MSATSVTEQWQGIDGASKSEDGRTGTTESVRVFEVLIDDPENDSDIVARTASVGGVSVPRLRDPHPGNSFLRCNSVSARRTSLFSYDVICGYATPSPTDQHPTSIPAKISFSSITSSELVDEDINGKPMVTACGEPFPPMPFDQKDQRVIIELAVRNYDELADSLFYNAVNQDTFIRYPPGTCRIVERKVDPVYDDDVGGYFNTVTEIHVRRGAPRTTDAHAWWRRVRHEGLYRRIDVGLKPRRAKDAEGKETVLPVLLDQDGVRIPDAIPPAVPAAQWLEFQQYPVRNYADLGLF